MFMLCSPHNGSLFRVKLSQEGSWRRERKRERFLLEMKKFLQHFNQFDEEKLSTKRAFFFYGSFPFLLIGFLWPWIGVL